MLTTVVVLVCFVCGPLNLYLGRRARSIRDPSHVGLLRDAPTGSDAAKGVRDQRGG
jgi:hypothetical protein